VNLDCFNYASSIYTADCYKEDHRNHLIKTLHPHQSTYFNLRIAKEDLPNLSSRINQGCTEGLEPFLKELGKKITYIAL